MTIDESIERCETLATNGQIIFSRDHDIAEECNEKYKQLAEWLKELKSYREIGTVEECKNSVLNILKAYNKAIDDFVKEICKMIVQSENNGNYRFYAVEIKQAIADLAEQLKVGVSDGNIQ